MDRVERSEEQPGVFRVTSYKTQYVPVGGGFYELRLRVHSYYENAQRQPSKRPTETSVRTPPGPRWRLMLQTDPPALQAKAVTIHDPDPCRIVPDEASP